MGVGDEAPHRHGSARRGRGGDGRPRRAGRPGGIDASPPARARVGTRSGGRSAADAAGEAPDLLELRDRARGRARRVAGRHVLRGLPASGRLRAPRPRRRAARLARMGLSWPARRSARIRAGIARTVHRRCRDARGGDVGAVPRSLRRAAGLGPDVAERLGARIRAPRREVAALDGYARVAVHIRPLRRRRHLPVGRPGRPPRARRPHRQAVRGLGEGCVARAVRRRRRRTGGG